MTSKTTQVVENVLEHADAGLEKTEAVVEETLETLERIPKVNLNGTTKGQQILILTFTAGVAGAAGAFAGYKFAQNKLRKHYEDIAEREIAEAREFYATSKTGAFSDPKSAHEALHPDEELPKVTSTSPIVQEAAEAQSEYAAGTLTQSEKDRLQTKESLRVPYHEMYQGDISKEQADAIIEKDPNADPQEVMGRIRFPETPAEADNFDMEVEAPLRGMDTPYVITHDEFFAREREFEQQSLTWFSGDSVLIDSDEDVIGDVEYMVGTANMSRFGHGSKDKNIVYIRNERSEIDFEVALSEGTYTKDVLGLDPPG